MSYFPGLKLTKAGEQLLAKVSGNLSETISFRKAELGSGTINSDDEIRFLTALKEKWKDVNISDCKIVGNEQTQVQIELQFDNAGINTNKIFRELGIYAAANDGREVLFAYSNAKENFDYIPAATDNPQSFVINILITITSNTKVNAQIDLNSYVTLRKFNEELAKKLDKGAVSTEYDTAAKIEAKIKEAKNTADNKLTKGNLPAGISDAKTFYDLVEKGYGAELDENLFYLNDAGTKQVGKLYFDKNKKGLFKCIKQTTGTVNSTEFFVDASPNANSDRLTNLQANRYEYLVEPTQNVNGKVVEYDKSKLLKYRFVLLLAGASLVSMSALTIIPSHMFNPNLYSFNYYMDNDRTGITQITDTTIKFVHIAEASDGTPYVALLLM